MSLEHRYVQRVMDTARQAGVPVPAEVLTVASQLEHGDGGIFRRWRELHPDVNVDELPPCCWGVAVYGWHRCECWEPVFDVEQVEPVLPPPAGSIRVRPAGRCGDCAYRRDSAERSEPWGEDELLSLAAEGTPFWCHDGIRRPVAYRHPLLGEVPGIDADYRPPQVAGVPFKADGQPGFLCAGWAQEGRRLEREAATP